jgi:hypothetical protein
VKIYVNGDSFTAGDGLADSETFSDIYPGHHEASTARPPANQAWLDNRHLMFDNDADLWTLSRTNNQKYVWSTILGNLVNATVVNNAIGGSCMLGISTRTIADLESINSRADLPDYVFIGLTSSGRLGWYNDDVQHQNKIFNWVQSAIPGFYFQGREIKHKKLFEAVWTTLSDEELLINYLKECLQIKNYVRRRIGRDPIFLNTVGHFWQYKELVNNSKNQWLRMLWFDLLEFDKINAKWFNKGTFDQMTACGHLLPEAHSDYARDIAREHFGWGKLPIDRDAE